MACSCSVFSPNFLLNSPQQHQRASPASSEGEFLQLWNSSHTAAPGRARTRRIVADGSRISSTTTETCSPTSIGEQRAEEVRDEVFRLPLGWPGTLPDLHLLNELLVHRNFQHKDGDNVLRYGVAVQSTPPPPKQKKHDKGKNYHANVGYAIRSLREELPGMFYKEPTFDIYRDDITFRDPLIAFSGIANYKLMFWALRFYGRIFFKAIWIEIQRIWQPSDKVIMVRWTVFGIPRVPWEARGQFEATSEYKLDSEGLIYEHKVDNLVMNSPPKYKAPAVLDLVAAAGGQTPHPSYFQLPCLQRFTWVRFYLALRSTLVLNAVGALC